MRARHRRRSVRLDQLNCLGSSSTIAAFRGQRIAAFCRLKPFENVLPARVMRREVSFMGALMDTYARLPVSFDSGEGAYLFDKQGNKYLDALAGLAVTGLGHAHPRVTSAISRQASRLMHTSNLYQIELQETLATRLTELA